MKITKTIEVAESSENMVCVCGSFCDYTHSHQMVRLIL